MTKRGNIIWWVLFVGLTVALVCVVRSEQVKLTWPATGATNRVLLDGVQVDYTPGTNATIQVTNDVWPVGVQIIGGGKCYSTRFSIEPVARWTGGQEFATSVKGPWSLVALKPGSKLTGPSGFFRVVLVKTNEIVPWWTWAAREGREP